MLSDPITIVASAPTPALTLNRIQSDGYGAIYSDVTNGYNLTVSHALPGKTGERHYAKLEQVLNATDPYTGGTSKQTASVSVSWSFPAFGWDGSTKAALIKALQDIIADADVTVAKLLAFNS
jgi:hypothetical protein